MTDITPPELYITTFKSSVKESTQQGTVLQGTFEQFAAKFKSPEYGTKDGSYFVRGLLKNGRRLNANMQGLSVIILDGDSSINTQTGEVIAGAPPAFNVHEVLKHNEINHFIYSSYSHSETRSKWRCVIPVHPQHYEVSTQSITDIPQHLKMLLSANVNYLVDLLHDNGLYLFPVDENYTLSQPWFYPRTKDINTIQHYEFYQHTNGKCVNQKPDYTSKFKTKLTPHQDPAANPEATSTDTYAHSVAMVMSGTTFHKVLNNIIYGKVKDGMPRANIITDVSTLIKCSDAKNPKHEHHDKWLRESEEGMTEKRVDECIEKFRLTEKLETVEIADTENQYTCHEYPSGFIGEFARAIHERMEFANKEIAILSARHVVASLCGRKPSLYGTSKIEMANLMLAAQGVGKNTPNEILSKITQGALDEHLNQFEKTNIHLFEGSKGSYGVKALHEKMIVCPSVSIIIPEAGMNSRSSSGDKSSLSAYFMQNFTQPAYSKLYAQDYATKLPPVYGTVAVRLEESTISTYKENFNQDTLESGELARRNVHFIPHVTDADVETTRKPFSEHIVSGLAKLIKVALWGENMNNVTSDERYTGCCLAPLSKNLQLAYTLDKNATLLYAKCKQSEKKRRNDASAEDTQTMEWALSVRRLQKASREALFYAYVEDVTQTDVIDEAFFIPAENNKREVKLEHLEEALGYVAECDRGIIANSRFYDGAFTNVINAILLTCHRAIEGNSKTYINNHTRQQRDERVFSSRFIMHMSSSVKTSIKQAMKTYPNRIEMDIIKQALRQGEAYGYWSVLTPEEKAKFGIKLSTFYIQLQIDIQLQRNLVKRIKDNKLRKQDIPKNPPLEDKSADGIII